MATATNGKPATKPEATDEQKEHDRMKEWAARLERAEIEIYRAECDVDERSEQVKEAKAVLASRIGTLRRIVKERNQPVLPLFDEKPEPEAWREVPLTTLEFPKAAYKALDEAKLVTVGDLADYTKEYEISSIKGIGKVAAEKIADRMEQFWKDNPQPQETTQEEREDIADAIEAE